MSSCSFKSMFLHYVYIQDVFCPLVANNYLMFVLCDCHIMLITVCNRVCDTGRHEQVAISGLLY